jgi:hypothetical protein
VKPSSSVISLISGIRSLKLTTSHGEGRHFRRLTRMIWIDSAFNGMCLLCWHCQKRRTWTKDDAGKWPNDSIWKLTELLNALNTRGGHNLGRILLTMYHKIQNFHKCNTLLQKPPAERIKVVVHSHHPPAPYASSA